MQGLDAPELKYQQSTLLSQIVLLSLPGFVAEAGTLAWLAPLLLGMTNTPVLISEHPISDIEHTPYCYDFRKGKFSSVLFHQIVFWYSFTIIVLYISAKKTGILILTAFYYSINNLNWETGHKLTVGWTSI